VHHQREATIVGGVLTTLVNDADIENFGKGALGSRIYGIVDEVDFEGRNPLVVCIEVYRTEWA
jgi:hypothetical protein